MNIKKVSTVYFSATDTTKKVVRAVAGGTGLPHSEYGISHLYDLPQIPVFDETDLVIIGAPVYVGRVPKVLLGIFEELSGSNTPCILIGVYGNRHYDDFLIELGDLMQKRGFIPVAGAAFIGEHSFSKTLAAHRPNAEDLAAGEKLGKDVMYKLIDRQVVTAAGMPGNRPYKEPYGGAGKQEPFGPEFRSNCTQCGICAEKCPTGAILKPGDVDGAKCIKCYACIKNCPFDAIGFTNGQFLSHVKHLEDTYADYKQIEIFM